MKQSERLERIGRAIKNECRWLVEEISSAIKCDIGRLAAWAIRTELWLKVQIVGCIAVGFLVIGAFLYQVIPPVGFLMGMVA